MSAAYHLEKKGYRDIVICEKESQVGGLVRSVFQDGFTFDFSGHLIHSNNEYFSSLVDDLLPPSEREVIRRNAVVFLKNRFSPYPFQANLAGYPVKMISECIKEFVNRPSKDPANLHEWICHYFGKGLGKHFLFPFNRKILGYPLSKVMPNQLGRFIPRITLDDLVEGISGSKSTHGYNARFFYPKSGGIQTLSNNLAAQITTPISHSKRAVHVDMLAKKVTFNDGSSIHYKHLVSTLPLKQLLQHSHTPTASNLTTAPENLLCNKVFNFNVGLAQPNQDNRHWVYIPEKKYPFYRLGFWSNFSTNMTPPGCSSFYGEISYLPEAGQEKPDIDAAVEKALNILNINHSKVMTVRTLTLEHAYVIYNRWRNTYISKVLEELDGHDIISTGRFGGWKYSSMQEAVLDGKEAAEHIDEKLSTQRTSFLKPEVKHVSATL